MIPGFGDDGPYPSDELTFVVPYGPGGSTDPIARQFTHQLEKKLGTKIVVENREGGSATIGTSRIVKAPPDGYTIGLSSNSAVAYQPILTDALPYHSTADYQPLVKLADLPTILAVRADAPWKTFKEFMDDARRRPGEIKISNSGARTAPDLTIQRLSQAGGVEFTGVPFSGGGGEALTALLSGEVDACAGYAPTVKEHVRAGKLRVLGAFHKGAYKIFPGAESVVEAGYDVTLPASYYVIAPKGIPADVLGRLQKAADETVRSPEFLRFAEDKGYVLENLNPDQVTTELDEYQTEYERLNAFMEERPA
ncbi:Bug family tripartite tricarboxylate transporter substrate binding protein [Nonomuraea sp. NPDC002799]